MTPADAAAAIKTKLETDWAALHAGATVTWPNDPAPVIDPAELHMKAEIRWGPEALDEVAGTVGQNLYSRSGEVLMYILGPSIIEETAIRSYADEAAGIFRSYIDGDLAFDAVDHFGGGFFERDGNWFLIGASAHFTLALSG